MSHSAATRTAARLFGIVVASLSALALVTPACALPIPYMTIEPDPAGGFRRTSTFDATPKPYFVYSLNLSGPIDYSFKLPKEGWIGDLTNRNEIAPLPQWARDLLVRSVLPVWENPPGPQATPQVMALGLASATRKDVTADELRAHDSAYLAMQAARPTYREQAEPVGANIVFAFADFGSDFVQGLLDRFDWPDKSLDRNGRLPSWSERTHDLEKDSEGNITGAKGGAEVFVDGTLGVWIPAQWRNEAGRLIYGPHETSTDLVLFNRKVAWHQTMAAPAMDRIDFYSVALHETGHDLGFDHARVPAPSTLVLALSALMALGMVGLRSTASLPAG